MAEQCPDQLVSVRTHVEHELAGEVAELMWRDPNPELTEKAIEVSWYRTVELSLWLAGISPGKRKSDGPAASTGRAWSR